MRILVLVLFMLCSGCNTTGSLYGEVEHISSIPNGNPFNDRKETSADVLWTGIKLTYPSGWYIDGAVGIDTSGEFEGRNPYGKFKVGKEIKTWGD